MMCTDSCGFVSLCLHRLCPAKCLERRCVAHVLLLFCFNQSQCSVDGRFHIMIHLSFLLSHLLFLLSHSLPKPMSLLDTEAQEMVKEVGDDHKDNKHTFHSQALLTFCSKISGINALTLPMCCLPFSIKSWLLVDNFFLVGLLVPNAVLGSKTHPILNTVLFLHFLFLLPWLLLT